MFRAYVTDDHALLRQGLKSLLSDDPELRITGESGTGKETLKDLAQGGYDLLVLDLSLPDMDGFEILQKVKRHHPELPVMILTLHADVSLAVRLLKLGASGYALKEMDPHQIIDAMRRIARGGRFLAPELAARMAERVSTELDVSPHERLSDREYTVFLKLASGISLANTARELNISASTVSTHRDHILKKLELPNTAALIRYAVANKLLLPR
ncbi:MAG: response regulator transcription factor [Magnetococcus sp. YQC-9]